MEKITDEERDRMVRELAEDPGIQRVNKRLSALLDDVGLEDGPARDAIIYATGQMAGWAYQIGRRSIKST